MNELANVTINTTASFNFKNKKLNEISAKIAKAGADMSSKNKEIAKLLGSVKKGKLYSDDGFKSVSEYAEKTFGIAKSLAYQLANVGERFYLVDSETAKKAAALLPPSNLAEIAGMTDEAIQKAIDKGTIKAASTQKELRETAKKAKDEAEKANKPTSKTSSKARVIPQYEADVTIFRMEGADRIHFDKADMDTIDKAVKERINLDGAQSKVFVREGKYEKEYHRGITVWLTLSGVVVLNYGLASKPPKADKPAEKEYTVAEIEAMLKAAKEKEAKKAAEAKAAEK